MVSADCYCQPYARRRQSRHPKRWCHRLEHLSAKNLLEVSRLFLLNCATGQRWEFKQ